MKKNLIYTFVAMLAMILGSCSSTQNSAIKGDWLIKNACGVSTEGGMNQAEISFAGDGKIHGNASVNSFFGTYKQQDDKLTLDQVGMTRMMGPGMNIEDAVTKAINSAAKVKVDGDNATIYDADGKEIMLLQRKK